MNAKTARILFGVLLGFGGGICFGSVARLAVLTLLRNGYNTYYADIGSELPGLGMFLVGWVTGILVPMVNRRWLRPLVGAGVWPAGNLIFLTLPFIHPYLLIPGPVMVVCSLISLLSGAVVGGIAAWVDFP
jgi:hypothetical protein